MPRHMLFFFICNCSFTLFYSNKAACHEANEKQTIPKAFPSQGKVGREAARMRCSLNMKTFLLRSIIQCRIHLIRPLRGEGFWLSFYTTKKKPFVRTASIGIRRRPTLPGRVQPSTIGAEGLNFCVRYGNRWDPFAIATGNCIHFAWPALRLPMLVVHP